MTSQCQRPAGLFGRFVIWTMNRRHSALTDWGLGHVQLRDGDAVLDAGCGGGRTVQKLAARLPHSRVYGVDFSPASVAAARRLNRARIEASRVEITEASVSALPFADSTFDVITAVETHFWWPDLPRDLREVRRVLKPGGQLALVAEFYNGGRHAWYAERASRFTGIAALTLGEHREVLRGAGFTTVTIQEEERRGWMCAVAS